MDETKGFPLFPLGTVLFPGNVIPLQIFEPRYRSMLSDCMDADRRFGIVLISGGREVGGRAETHSVGTVARIVSVSEVAEGRFFLSAEGEGRFRLVERCEDDPYPRGRVEPIAEEPGCGGEELEELGRAVRSGAQDLLSLVIGLGGGWTSEPALPDSPAELSYYVPKLLRIGLAERQRLLEAATTSERLGAEAEMLDRQVGSLRKRVAAELGGRFSVN